MNERKTCRQIMEEQDASETRRLKWQTYLVEAVCGLVRKQVTRAFQTAVKKRLAADGIAAYVGYEDQYSYRLNLGGQDTGLDRNHEVGLYFGSNNGSRPVYAPEDRQRHVQGLQVLAEQCNLRRHLLATTKPEELDATIAAVNEALAAAKQTLDALPDHYLISDLLPKER